MTKSISIEATLEDLKKQPAWGLIRSNGSMFFLEIGQPRPRPDRKKVHGEWHFLIQMCHWRMEKKGILIVGSDDHQNLIDRTFASLELGYVQNAKVAATSFDLHLVFSSGLQLSTFCSSTSASDELTQWMLFCPNDYTWLVKAGDTPIRKGIHE